MERICQVGGVGRYADVPADHSMAVLASVFGYSRSELDVSLQDGDLVWFRSLSGRVMLQLASIEPEHSVGRVQLWGAGDINDVLDGLRQLAGQYGFKRLCSYVFPWEQDEIHTLQAAGFEYEATFREHVHARGRLQDLLVFGRLSEAM